MESNYKEKLKMIMTKYPKIRECIRDDDWETLWEGLLSTTPTTVLSDERLLWNPLWACLFMTAFAESKIDCQLKEIPDNLSSNAPVGHIMENELTMIIIPNGVEKIGNDAFSNCYSLKDIYVPTSIKEIGYNAFGVNSLVRTTVLSTLKRNIVLPSKFRDPEVLDDIGIVSTDRLTFI